MNKTEDLLKCVYVLNLLQLPKISSKFYKMFLSTRFAILWTQYFGFSFVNLGIPANN